MGSRLRSLTLYAGAGGADLGLRDAGVEHVACVEADADCCATLAAAGFPAVRAGIGGPYEVRRGKARRLVETVAAFDPGPYVGADLVWASPPCQPYSRAGKGLGAADERDGWASTLGVLRVVRPRWVVVENVSGAPVAEWTADLEVLGFVVSARTLDAADYGVPQNRVREFLVGGPHAIEWPRPTHYGPKLPGLLRAGRVPWVSMGEALPGLTFVGGGSSPHFPGDVRTERELTNEPSTTIAGPSGNCAPFVVDPKHPPCDPSRPATTVRSGGSGHSAPPMFVRTESVGAIARPVSEPAPTVPTKWNQYLHDSDVGARTTHTRLTGGRSATEPERLGRPAPTITVADGQGLGSSAARDDMERRIGRRRLTWQECATLQDFPADHPFQGTVTSRYRQVGNAVPRTMARVIVEAVLAADRARGAA